jgi:exonuclease III
MRIATWNINSVRLRAPLLEQLDKQAAPDIICLQEAQKDGRFLFAPRHLHHKKQNHTSNRYLN